jgi:hypothetical protein
MVLIENGERRYASTRRTTRLGRTPRWERDEGDGFRGKKSRAFGGDESVGSDTQSRMVMKSAPTSAFEVIDADLVLELLIVTFDAPPHVDGRDEFLERG